MVRMEKASPKKSLLKKVEGQVEFDLVIGLGRAYRKQKHKLAKSWRLRNGVCVREMSNHVFYFVSVVQRHWLATAPWSDVLILSLCCSVDAILKDLCLFSRSVRFRWYQGFYPAGSQPVTWAIDNVYIGPQCEEMCNGHGSCINGTKCICDPGYSGPTCKISTKNPDFLKDDFEGNLLK